MRDCWSFEVLRFGVENIGEEEEQVDRSCWEDIFVKYWLRFSGCCPNSMHNFCNFQFIDVFKSKDF